MASKSAHAHTTTKKKKYSGWSKFVFDGILQVVVNVNIVEGVMRLVCMCEFCQCVFKVTVGNLETLIIEGILMIWASIILIF